MSVSRTDSDRREELLEAARGGVRDFLRTLRGSNLFGADPEVIPTRRGFAVVYRNDERIYFEAREVT